MCPLDLFQCFGNIKNFIISNHSKGSGRAEIRQNNRHIMGKKKETKILKIKGVRKLF